MNKFYIGAAIATALIGGMVFEAARSDNSSSGTERKVAATIFPLYDITREIAGDEFEVVLMLPTGASPHTFDPQPSLIKDLEGSQAVFSIGSGLDTWSASVTDSIGAEAVTVDAGVTLRETAEDDHGNHDDEEEGEDGYAHDDDEHEDEEDSHVHGPVDPHYWLSIHNAEQIAENISAELGELDNENASLYASRADAYGEQLEILESELEGKVADLSGRNIISLHDAWEYFAAEFGLSIVGTFEPTGGEEPTPQYLATLQEEVAENNVSTLFVEPQLSTASVNAFADDNNLTIAEIDPLGGVEGRSSYIELMRYNVDQVVSALQ